MNHSNARKTSVALGDGGFTVDEARSLLLEAGCAESAVTRQWVANHWALVLVKLAALVRWRATLLPTLWSREAVLNQLKYRYACSLALTLPC